MSPIDTSFNENSERKSDYLLSQAWADFMKRQD